MRNTERKQKKTYVSRLHITKLEVHDSGFYKCVASDGILSKSSTGVLMVQPAHSKHFQFTKCILAKSM